ncbi:hypothetical protein BDQ17DRAFT_1422843 [Cyathus striatus]|nr:hypothetical protein BDQ17DRAFT_1422843 [Cyathus striatus]
MNKLLVALEAVKAKFPQLRGLSGFNPRLHRLDSKMMVHLYDVLDDEEAAKRSPDFIMVSESLLDAEVFKWTEILTTWELKLAGSRGFPTALNRYSKKELKKHIFLPDDPILKSNQMSATDLYIGDNPAIGLAEQSLVNPVSLSGSSGGASTACPAGDSSKRSAMNDDCIATPSAKRAKFAPNPKKLEHNYQNALYGYEMLSRGIYCIHSLNFLAVDDVLWTRRYDRQNAIQSSGLNFVEDAPYFIALLLALQRFGMADWGVDPVLALPFMFMGRGGNLKPAKINFEFVLQSGATIILDAWTSSEKGLMIEAYWPEQTRLNEAHIIEENCRESLN